MKTLRRPRRLRPPRTERCDGEGREGTAGAAGETGQARAAGFRRDQGRQGVAGYVFHKKLSEVCWEKNIFVFSGLYGTKGDKGLPGPPSLPGPKGDRVRNLYYKLFELFK